MTCAWGQQVEHLTDEQISQFVQQVQASGISEAQLEQMALGRGYTRADIMKVRQRIQQRATAGQTQSTTSVTTHNPAETTTRREPPMVVAPPASVSSAVFGASLFANNNLTFEPNLRIPTPRNYQIGPDDELIIDVYGNAQQTYRPRVSPEGSVRLENLGPIYINGLTVDQAEQRIVRRLRTLYQGLNTAGSGIYGQVTLGSIRSIRVTLLGQLVRPGTYTLSSLATVFNALYAAGGPAPDRGSFRNVRIYRANRLIRTLDMYDFLLRADQKDNIRLSDQDIVFVDHYTSRVELTGEVKQPGVYEIKPDETLRSVLQFAGNYTDRAYTASINLYRNTPTEQQLLTINAGEVDGFMPKAGDRYQVQAILPRLANKVSIQGAVFRPGAFALQQSRTLKQLISRAEGLREDAFLNRATIRRLRPNLDPELISVDLGKLLRGDLPDIDLQREDSVQIMAVGDLRPNRTVSILGAVNRGGTFPFADSMTVATLIVLAGGFSEGATSSRLEIARRIQGDSSGLPSNQTIQVITFGIDHSLRLSTADAQLTLQPFDQVFVRVSPRYEAQKGVSILGEVLYPGPYAIRSATDRITDLIARAGGLKPDAYVPAARFSRHGDVLSLDMQKILSDPTDRGNLVLEGQDTLLIPRRVELVRIRGEVLNPAIVAFNPAYSLRDYVRQAGNFTRKALRRKIYVIAANGKISSTQSFLGIHRFPKPERGMEIVVPTEPLKGQTKLSTTERATLLTVLASASAVLLTALRIFVN